MSKSKAQMMADMHEALKPFDMAGCWAEVSSHGKLRFRDIPYFIDAETALLLADWIYEHFKEGR